MITTSARFSHALLKDFVLPELKEELENRNSGTFTDWSSFKKEIIDQTIKSFKFYAIGTYHDKYIQTILLLNSISDQYQESPTEFNIWCYDIAKEFYFKIKEKYNKLEESATTHTRRKFLLKQQGDLTRIATLYNY